MRYTDEGDFLKAYNAGGVSGIYLLYGSEEYLIDTWKAKLCKPFAQSGAFNLQRLEGRSLDLDALYDAVETLPLMAQQKCVVVEDLDVSRLQSGDMDKLADILENPNPECVLIITGKSAFDPKSANGKRVLKLAEAAGTVAELGTRNQAGLISFLRGIAKRNGCELSAELARLIVSTCGDDMNTLRCEAEKICAYACYGEIRREHIEAVATARIEARVFDLSKAILSAQPKRAMDILADLFELREPPIAILSTLILSYVDLYRARVSKKQGIAVNDAIQKFGYKGREFRLRNAFNSRLSLGALRDALGALYNCDARMKSSGIDDKVLLEQTVIRLFQIGAAAYND